MAYNDFKLQDIKNKFGVNLQENDPLFQKVEPSEVSELLTELLRNWVPLAHAIGTEKARSEFIIAPVLAEVRSRCKVSLFSGITFNVDPQQGLVGVCDFLLSRSAEQFALVSPVVAVVEAKNENIPAGIPQCMAEMIAARIFNEREGNRISSVFGCVTTGTLWKFLKYSENEFFIDIDDYYIPETGKILGIFKEILVERSGPG